jgi:hypothetical protein
MSATSFDLKEQLELLSELGPLSRIELLSEVSHRGEKFPIYGITITRSTDPSVPTFALVGGVHGLESIGTTVILSYLRSLNQYLSWDKNLQEFLKNIRLVFLPHLNPVGAHLGQRSNGNGVDLMRNGPLESEEKISSLHIYRGHRISPFLPWYRGKENQPMEIESQTLINFIEREVFCSKLAICVDVHSGFGAIDRLWFPYARKKGFFPDISNVTSLKNLLDQTLPNHIYRMEPQSVSYTVHGDLWDYLYEKHREQYPERVFLPLTLEMGSWNWLKKNPFQIFTRQGIFHPIKRHRTRRVLRRHAALFDFLSRATASPDSWLPKDESAREKLRTKAEELWG